MPLQVKNGIPLYPQPAQVATKKVAYRARKALDDAPPEPITLNIEHAFQETKLWCWAACIEMVLKYYDPKSTVTQCDILKTKLGDKGHPCPEDENQAEPGIDDCEPILMAQTWRDCGIKEVVPVNDVVSMHIIKEELKAHRPLEVGIGWTNGGGHAVLIKGWAATTPESLVIDDPLRQSPLGLPATGRATYDDLIDALGHGVWQYTWARLA